MEKILKKSQLFLLINIFTIVGIVVGFFVFVDHFYLFVIILALLVLLILIYKNNILKLVLLSLCFLVLGLWRYNIHAQTTNLSYSDFYNAEENNFIGIISNEPDIRIENTKLAISALSNDGKIIKEKILVIANRYPEYDYGDKLLISCDLKKPEPFNNFSYDKYLARRDIYWLCYYPKIKVISKNNGSIFFTNIFKFKHKLHKIINQNMAEPQSSLLSAIILGYKQTVPKDLIEKFSKTGISHIIAISGMHISIIGVIVLYLCIALGLSRNQAFYLSVFLMSLFVLIIGLPASAVRASIMCFVVLFALKIGRLSKGVNALLFCATLMLIFNPYLIFDIGFQLSFTALFGILFIFPVLGLICIKIPDYKKIKTLILVTISAQITTLPLVLFYFNKLSIIAPLTNLLITPLIPFVMILGLIFLVIGFVSNAAAQIFGWLIFFLFKYILIIVNFFNYIKIGSFSIIINLQNVILLYLIIFLLLLSYKNRRYLL